MTFVVCHASAGSGKTFTLVREYLGIVLKDPETFRHILAITFTNKAANEMKERVLEALRDLSGLQAGEPVNGSGTLAKLLCSDTGLTLQEIGGRAAQALKLILHHYNDFAIGTIDSFSHRLIRTFAFDFGLSVNFTVETESEELLSTAVSLLMDRVGDDKPLTDLLVRFLETRMDEDQGWNISDILIKFARLLLDEEGQSGLDALRQFTIDDFNRVTREVMVALRRFENEVRDVARRGLRVLEDSGLAPGDFYQGERGIWNYFRLPAAGRLDKLEPNTYVRTTMEEGRWFAAKATAMVQSAIESIRPAVEEAYAELQQLVEGHLGDYRLRRLLVRTLYPMAVLSEIDRVLTAFKQGNNLVHISEFNMRIASVVMNEPVPFIYERLGEKYRHIMVDEFQDTSVLQWLNMVPLMENSLAGGYFNLVVGDGKQAIYRWRGGEVEQFSSLPSLEGSGGNPLLERREAVLRQHFKEINLERNYRSRAEIVDFNNRFFSKLSSLVLDGKRHGIYRALEQEFDPAGTGGFVSIRFMENGEGEAGYHESTLLEILSLVREANALGYRLSDVAVLCRSNTQASDVARFLLDSGLEVVSAESLLLAGSPGVRLLISLLRHLVEPPNELVDSEIRFMTGGDVRKGDLPSAADREAMVSLPVYDLCERLMQRYNLDPVADPFLRFFLDAVLKFTNSFSPGPLEFLEWWEKKKAGLSIVVPEELDAVRVMTIHKAKGLEFPVVILPFSHETLKNTRDHLWIGLDPALAGGLTTAVVRSDKSLEGTRYAGALEEESQKSMLDLLNIRYVAMTRACNRMHILTRTPPRREDGIKSLPGFYRLFLQEEKMWEEGRGEYTFGSREVRCAAQALPRKAGKTIDSYGTGDWRKRISLRSVPVKPAPGSMAGTKLETGRSLHEILSEIRSEADVQEAVDRAVSAGKWAPSLSGEAVNTLLEVTRHPALAGVFNRQSEVRTEAEILLPDGSVFRPDRVVFGKDDVTVVEYKTGKPGEAHGNQLRHYVSLIRSMGYGMVKGLLVYMDPMVVVEEI